MKNIAVLVLAAGNSSRMQTPKQLLKIGDKTLIEHVLEKAKAISKNPIFCVLGANALLIQEKISSENVVFIINKNYKEGLSSSIVSGIDYLEKNHPTIDGVLILLADQPAIEIYYLENLIQLFNQQVAKIIVSKYPENVGVPAIFPKEFFQELQTLQGDFGAKEFLKNNKNNCVFSNFNATLIDLDTKSDYENYRKLLEK